MGSQRGEWKLLRRPHVFGLGDSTYFPAANAQKEAHHIGLLLLLELFDILEGTHLDCDKQAEVSRFCFLIQKMEMGSSVVARSESSEGEGTNQLFT